MRTLYFISLLVSLTISAFGQPSALPPNMLFLPNGTYEMGCTSEQTPCSANNQAHLVEIDSFYLSAYEITQAQYEAVMGANPSINSGCPECPVENVSWYDALNFCNQLSLQNNLEPCYYADPQLSQPFSGSTGPVYWYTEANGFRLPTEAEWEYAARSAGADDFVYAGSNNFNEVAWLAAGSTQAAGQLLPNSIGLYDMSGNASEWVWDYIADFTNSLACQPLGPGTGSERVRRGGSFQSASTFKLATRESAPPGSNSGHTGFRVASNNGSLPPASLSCVAGLVEPMEGASDVSAQTSISWEAVAEAEGYFLSLGTSPGGTDLLNELDLGNTTLYTPITCLSGNSDIFVTISPYNSVGEATGCSVFLFSTGPALPTTPTAPDGLSQVCAGETESYSTSPVSGADTYSWSVTGGNITAGQGSTSITVNWTDGIGTVCVSAQNQCGVSNEACATVSSVSLPVSPTTPSGPSPVSAGDIESYTTNPVSGASSYTWTVTGGNVLSGQGSTSVQVSWTSAGGEVCVAASNTCGSSPPGCLTVDGNTTPPPSMISVPGGTFDMGCTAEQTQSDCVSPEFPVHTVTLSSFQISATEVTQAQWLAQVPEYDPFIAVLGLGNNYPAYEISWFDAVTYCNRLSQSQGLTPAYYANPGYTQVYDALDDGNGAVYWNQSANGYRLPTEAEWEYAARGAGVAPQTEFSGSNDINAVAWWSGNGGGQSQPVGTKNPNALNTFDMSGNVWEWCWDRYGGDYYSNSPANNPTGPTSGDIQIRRGGSWSNPAPICRVAGRNIHNPWVRSNYVGFRLSRTP